MELKTLSDVRIPDYEVVIPHYNRSEMLRTLLEHILGVNSYKLPSRVIVVDDASSSRHRDSLLAIRDQMSSPAMRIAVLPLDHQVGYYPCLREGLSLVTKEYAVCCVDDIRLAIKRNGRYLAPALRNPFCTLIYYLEAIRAIAREPESTASRAGIIFPFVLQWEMPHLILAADLAFHSLKKGMPPLITNNKNGWAAVSLMKTHHFDLYETCIGHQYCFGLNMEDYKTAGGFDPQLDPYPHGIYDLCLSMRSQRIAVYMTSNAAVFHRRAGYKKPEGSLSNNLALGKQYQATCEAFFEKWKSAKVSAFVKQLNPPIINHIGGFSYGELD